MATQLTYRFELDVPETVVSFNCECDDATGYRTLKELRDDLMRRLGYGAQVNAPPPGMTELLNSFLIEAQTLLYRRFKALRTERFFTWPLVAGVRLYDLPANAETCTKRLDALKLAWVGIERNDIWTQLVESIPPELYTQAPTALPQRYEIRQCIELWPTPSESVGKLVIKGHFGIEAFAVDTDRTTIDDTLVFQLALANAKAHYRQPDANQYIAQAEVLLMNLVAGTHGTARYVPSTQPLSQSRYTEPRPTVPFE